MYEFAKDLFVEESEVKFYGFRVQTRMAVVRLPGARLLLYSPVPLTTRLRQELEQLGQISFIVSPNKIHNLTLADYRAALRLRPDHNGARAGLVRLDASTGQP